MSSSGRWRNLDAVTEITPSLLVRTQFSASGHEIALTDLSHIWQTSATKDEVVQQASEIGSSIDPGQDDEQFNIFLSKIESAITGEDGTTLELRNADKDGTFIAIDLSAKLPRPLPPFTWTLNLQLLPRQDTERLLISPLLRQASQLQQQIQQLIAELHDKDRVISKICDRLETSGNDLTTVFPGVSNIKTNRKKGQREQLAKHVKGLGDFDEAAWKAQAEARRDDGDLASAEMNDVLRGLPAVAATSSTQAAWWRNLDNISANKTNGEAKFTRTTVARHESTVADDDDFQTQSTPPHLKRISPQDEPEQQTVQPAPTVASPSAKNSTNTVADDDDSTTEDEDDLDTAPSRSQVAKAVPSETSHQKAPSPSPRKLGTFGGRSANKSAPDAHDTTPKEQTSGPEAKPRSKLGKIGGKDKSTEVAPSEPKADATASDADARPKKMGMMGGKRASGDVRSPIEDAAQEPVTNDSLHEKQERPARASAKAKSPAPRENSEERADRKRDMLKRELEEKAKAPAKKKRKF